MKQQNHNLLSKNPKIAVIIPALNEEASIGKVIRGLPHKKYKLDVMVCDNGSTDKTVSKVKQAGGRVVFEKKKRLWCCLFNSLKSYTSRYRNYHVY